MIKKKPFVLLEVLIAMLLVSTTLLPFIRIPHRQILKQLDFLFETALEFRAQEDLVDIQQRFYENKIESNFLFNEKRENYEEKEEFFLNIGKFKRKIVRKLRVRWKGQKKLPDGTFVIHTEAKFFYYSPKDLRVSVGNAATSFIVMGKPG